MGKYVYNKDQPKRSFSEISVSEPNISEIVKLKKLADVQHPLKQEDPKAWNNIPQCVQNEFITVL